MQSNLNENRVRLKGRVAALPAPSHSNHGISYFCMPLAVKRLSGAEDRLNVILSETQLSALSPEPGDQVAVRGEVRTFNNRSGVGSRLIVSVFARELSFEMGEDENRLELSGTLCKPPILRATPLGRTICDMILAVNRRYGRADYLPCIAWGSLAHRCGELTVGDRIRLSGRLQSRVYTKLIDGAPEERVAFEVSVMTIDWGDRAEGCGNARES
jgi:primosomal replication protein N